MIGWPTTLTFAFVSDVEAVFVNHSQAVGEVRLLFVAPERQPDLATTDEAGVAGNPAHLAGAAGGRQAAVALDSATGASFVTDAV